VWRAIRLEYHSSIGVSTKGRLVEIGGWEAMADYHSDDFELGKRIAGKGHRVELMREAVCVVFPEETFQELYRDELRWAIGLRNVRPAAYAGMIFTHGLPWAVLAAAVAVAASWTGIAAAYLAGYLIFRIGMGGAAGVWGLGDRSIAGQRWVLPLRDAISAVVWSMGFFSDRIRWRGSEFRVKNGLLTAVAEHSQKI
jgi:ceramide glucosyltransferase